MERACGGPVALVGGQELWLVVGGCATEAAALEYATSALLSAQFDCAALRGRNAALERRDALLEADCAALMVRNASLKEEVAAAKEDAASKAAILRSISAAVASILRRKEQQDEEAARKALIKEANALIESFALREAAERESIHRRDAESLEAEWEAERLIRICGGANKALIDASEMLDEEEAKTSVVVRLVRHHGADVSFTCDYERNTPLHYAARHGNIEVVRVLVNAFCADVNAKGGRRDHSPLHLASQQRRIETAVALVKELGADVSARDEVGLDPSAHCNV